MLFLTIPRNFFQSAYGKIFPVCTYFVITATSTTTLNFLKKNSASRASWWRFQKKKLYLCLSTILTIPLKAQRTSKILKKWCTNLKNGSLQPAGTHFFSSTPWLWPSNFSTNLQNPSKPWDSRSLCKILAAAWEKSQKWLKKPTGKISSWATKILWKIFSGRGVFSKLFSFLVLLFFFFLY